MVQAADAIGHVLRDRGGLAHKADAFGKDIDGAWRTSIVARSSARPFRRRWLQTARTESRALSALLDSDGSSSTRSMSSAWSAVTGSSDSGAVRIAINGTLAGCDVIIVDSRGGDAKSSATGLEACPVVEQYPY